LAQKIEVENVSEVKTSRALAQMNLDNVVVSNDVTKLDRQFVYQYLSNSYWGQGRTVEEVNTSIEHSICFGVYLGSEQIGFARVVTDQAFFAYLADVFVVDAYQGQGVAKRLLDAILSDERLQTLRRFLLATRDAHSLYERYEFERFTEEDAAMFMCKRQF
jgi:GNAT superfamily N-acetyltransferase